MAERERGKENMGSQSSGSHLLLPSVYFLKTLFLQTHCVVENDLELLVLLTPKCCNYWGYSHGTHHWTQVNSTRTGPRALCTLNRAPLTELHLQVHFLFCSTQ